MKLWHIDLFCFALLFVLEGHEGDAQCCKGDIRIRNLEKGGWNLVFLARSGNGRNVYDAWTKGTGTTKVKPKFLKRSYEEHFRSEEIRNWPRDVTKVKFAFYHQNREVTSVIFKTDDCSREDWFTYKNVIESSYSDLTNEKDNYNFFSIAGDYRPGEIVRRFLINSFYNGCPNDKGHIAVIDTNAVKRWCDFDKQPTFPQFLYSQINSVDLWDRLQFGRADFLLIFLQRRNKARQVEQEIEQLFGAADENLD